MDRPKTGLNVSEFVQNILMDNGFNEDESANVPIVADEASNMNDFGK